MDIQSMIRELETIQRLVLAYEALSDAYYESAAIEALEAIKTQIGVLMDCLSEAARVEAAA